MSLFNRKEMDIIVTKTSKQALADFAEKEKKDIRNRTCPECGTIRTGFGTCNSDYSFHICSNDNCRCEWKTKK